MVRADYAGFSGLTHILHYGTNSVTGDEFSTMVLLYPQSLLLIFNCHRVCIALIVEIAIDLSCSGFIKMEYLNKYRMN